MVALAATLSSFACRAAGHVVTEANGLAGGCGGLLAYELCRHANSRVLLGSFLGFAFATTLATFDISQLTLKVLNMAPQSFIFR